MVLVEQLQLVFFESIILMLNFLFYSRFDVLDNVPSVKTQ